MAAVDLEFGCFGKPENPPLVILHGLLGSSRNWMGVGKTLSEYFNVFAIDLRNHGNSPHADSMRYQDMVDDLVKWFEDKNISKAYLLGHSMGGKVAMAFACQNPDKLRGLIIEDIAMKEYSKRYDVEFDAMNSLDLDKVHSRSDADKLLESKISDAQWRQFLMTNLARDAEKKCFYWKVNLKALTEYLPNILKRSIRENEYYQGPCLFLRGENSDYIQDEDYDTIIEHFPRAAIVKVPDAGHNLHIDNPAFLVDILKQFLERTSHGASQKSA